MVAIKKISGIQVATLHVYAPFLHPFASGLRPHFSMLRIAAPNTIVSLAVLQNMDHIDSMRTLREMKICRHLRGHENIVKLLHVIPQHKEGPLDEVYLIFEFMESDLGKFIRTGAMAEFPLDHQRALTQGFLYQMLRGLKVPSRAASCTWRE